MGNLKFIKEEHPIVAQVFGSKPELFQEAAKIIKKMGFDGIDLNMGCPNKEIEKQGGGAALIKNLELAKEIIRATKKGAGGLPVSVKTRIGYSKNEITKWISGLLAENLAVLTVHLHTREEMSKSPAHWEAAKDIIKLRDKISPKTLIFGNGGVKSLTEAKYLSKKYGLDGIMIGRAVLADPWFFSKSASAGALVPSGPAPLQRMRAAIGHIELFEKLNHAYRQAGKNNIDEKGRMKNFDSVKKFFKAYINGWDGAKELRERLMVAKSPAEAKKIIKLQKRG
jgi:tRNA-dihydrouridine synthase